MTSISKYIYIDKLDDIVHKLVILLEYQNTKIYLQKVMFQTGLKTFFLL